MKFNFLPREETFFQHFQEQAQLCRQAGDLLVTLLEDFEHFEIHLKALNEIEHQGDALVHKVSLQLARSFVTPIDREDIHSLSAYLDDILDYCQSSAVKMSTYQVQKPTEEAFHLARLIQKISGVIHQAVDRMVELQDISELRREVKVIEKEADTVYRTAVAELFRHETDAIRLIKWKEIYKSLETVTDKCEDVMDVLEGVVIKYA